ncbi:MAG: hypothetical protein WCF84_09495 [Anaerolineae bacterium]
MSDNISKYPMESDRYGQGSDQINAASLENKLKQAKPLESDQNTITNVSLDQINLTDINSPSDFKSPEQYASMRREAEMLKYVKPAVEQGATADTFQSWDQQADIGSYTPNGYTRGYLDVYHTYYDLPNAVALTPHGDGTLDITNGRHRVYVTREAGFTNIPARILH